MAYDLAAYSILDAPPNPGADTMSVEAAYRVAAAGSLQSVRAALEVVGRRQSTQRTLLLAAADLLSGQVPRAMRVLEDGLEPATANARPFLIDILAPLYVMSNQLEELEDLVETVPEDHPSPSASPHSASFATPVSDIGRPSTPISTTSRTSWAVSTTTYSLGRLLNASLLPPTIPNGMSLQCVLPSKVCKLLYACRPLD